MHAARGVFLNGPQLQPRHLSSVHGTPRWSLDHAGLWSSPPDAYHTAAHSQGKPTQPKAYTAHSPHSLKPTQPTAYKLKPTQPTAYKTKAHAAAHRKGALGEAAPRQQSAGGLRVECVHTESLEATHLPGTDPLVKGLLIQTPKACSKGTTPAFTAPRYSSSSSSSNCTTNS